MNIFYRISPYLSSNPNPLGTDKYLILNRCLDSFLNANNGSPITFLVNSLSDDFIERRLKPYGKVVIAPEGNVETFQAQLECVIRLDNEEKVLLAEDDYLWAVGAVQSLTEALDQVYLVSPYDHPGHYTEERFKYQPKKMMLVGDQVYREAPSSTLTFACRAHVIKQNIDLIKSFGIRDHEMFQALGIDMWVPVPSLATHLVTGLIAPGFKFNL